MPIEVIEIVKMDILCEYCQFPTFDRKSFIQLYRFLLGMFIVHTHCNQIYSTFRV